MSSIAINGTDLSSLGFWLDGELPKLHSRALTKTPVILVSGVPGGEFGVTEVSERALPLSGTIIQTSVANRLSSEDSLNALLTGDLVLTYTRGDSSVRVLDCKLDGEVDIEPARPTTEAFQSKIRFLLKAATPTWRESSTTTVTMVSPAVDYSVALGSADSRAIITVPTPNTAEVVTIKNGAGSTVNTLTFSGLGSPDSLIIDNVRGEIETVTSGITSRAIDKLASATEFPFAFKRSWYSGATAPTIRTSHNDGTTVYYKRYW